MTTRAPYGPAPPSKMHGWLPILLIPAALSISWPILQPDRPATPPWSERIVKSFLVRHPDTILYPTEAKSRKWNYEQGLMMEAFHRYAEWSGDSQVVGYIRQNLDHYIQEDGSIRTYKMEDFNIDNVAPGKAAVRMYRRTGREKYRIAAEVLHEQLRRHPRVNAGGYWHKKIYPHQVWLDGIYMAQPFAALYASTFGEHETFDDIVQQILRIERRARDSATGLLYHGWDESKSQAWANPVTGCSPSFWGRAMGWYAMGLVDVLDDVPADHPGCGEVIAVLQRLAQAVARFQDPGTGLWYQLVDRGGEEGNYAEASASAMFTYALAKGVRMGYLDPEHLHVARRGFAGIIQELVTIDEEGGVNLTQVCSVAGLGGTPYRDGSPAYYYGEPRRTNDFKGVGPFLLAAVEIERAAVKNGQ